MEFRPLLNILSIRLRRINEKKRRLEARFPAALVRVDRNGVQVGIARSNSAYQVVVERWYRSRSPGNIQDVKFVIEVGQPLTITGTPAVAVKFIVPIQERDSMLGQLRRRLITIIALGSFLAVGTGSATARGWVLTVTGGDQTLAETPIVTAVQATVPVDLYLLTSDDGGPSLAAQVFQQGDRRMLATVLPHVAAGKVVTYSLERLISGDHDAFSGIRFRPKGQNLVVERHHVLLTEYHADAGHKPFFFPLIGPTGESYTRAYPLESLADEDHDHPHQRSLWFTHGNVNDVDFWGEAKNSGTIRESERELVAEGPVLGRLLTRNRWLAPDGRTVLDDQRVVTFYNTKSTRIIDFDIQLNASSGPVTFKDTKEGMFGIRVASSMDVSRKNGGKITNAEGLSDEKAWGQASPWVDYIGPVKNRIVGIAVLNHPESFRYPTTWHVRTYGLFAANPFGWHDFGKPIKGDYTVGAAKAITFRYRVILHDGDTKSVGLPQRFRAYATPPAVELKEQ